ncbi:MucBP domain-containing protein [Schleiferilactobacillus perolens]|uniref:MucBP domain-containing protein n=1 Tax=Schleiferilactobacillus perolens DSM 12744 TaxID=1423792 RepID=A0A0R1N2V0_9LACO|nr:MucBP domain-containing protein [Schleiferilactobacillus perolens]KRL14551.1 hypothetical protein FD09_GL000201 [Schleiferilactobacillus perolens DSM 12744]
MIKEKELRPGNRWLIGVAVLFAALAVLFSAIPVQAADDPSAGTVAGPVIVHYLEEDVSPITWEASGAPLTSEAKYPNGQLVGQPYTVQVNLVPKYRLDRIDTARSVPLKGTLTAAGGNIYAYFHRVGYVYTHYVDKTGADLATEELHWGIADTAYNFAPADIPGYQYQGLRSDSPSNMGTYQFVLIPTHIYFVYAKVTTGTVTAHYVDENGKAIHDPIATTGTIGDPYTTAQLSIDGYNFQKMSADSAATSGQYTADPQNVTYVYAPKPPVTQGTVVTSYVDEKGQTIHPDNTTTGQTGTAYTTAPVDIAGYTVAGLAPNSAAPAGQYTAGPLHVTYMYTTNAPVIQTGQVVTKYVNANGQPLHADTTSSGPVGTGYTTQPLAIAGYSNPQIAAGSAQPTGLYTVGAPLTVTYVYTKTVIPPVVQYGTVTTQYVDSQGNSIHAAATAKGVVGTAYNTDQLTIPGYTFKQIAAGSAATNGVFTNDSQTVTYVYEKTVTPPVVQYGTVTTKYVDAQGNSIHAVATAQGVVGTAYNTDQLTIPGYTFKQIAAGSAAANGVFTNGSQTVTYVYEKTVTPPVVQTGQVTAQYVDDQGNVLHHEIVTTGAVDSPYATEQLTFAGYTFKQIADHSAPADGHYTQNAQTVTYVYTKTNQSGQTPGTAGQSGDHSGSGQTAGGQAAAPTQPIQPGAVATPTNTKTMTRQSAARLPQTGEATGWAAVLLTLLGTLLLGGAVVSYRKLQD